MPQRSPVIFWLLLAATLCVDVVASVWLFDDMNRPPAASFFIALAYAQVSLLCVWAVLGRPSIWLRWLLPFGAGFLVAMIIVLAGMHSRTGQSFRWEQLFAFTSLMWVHVATLLLLLWLLKPTRLFAFGLASTNHPSWQFTIKHMLLVMTCLPILVIIFQRSAIVRSGVTLYGVFEFVAWVSGNALLPLAIVAIVQRKWRWVLQLAATAAAAIATGLFLRWAVPELSRDFYTTTLTLIQAFVIWAWLKVLQPIPPADVEFAPPSIGNVTPSC